MRFGVTDGDNNCFSLRGSSGGVMCLRTSAVGGRIKTRRKEGLREVINHLIFVIMAFEDRLETLAPDGPIPLRYIMMFMI